MAKDKCLFLFAHQDDEFAVLQAMTNALASGHKVYCAYFTTGAPSGQPFEHRNRESLSVLGRIGVPNTDIFFVGRELNIPDAGLPDRLEIAAEWLDRWLAEHGPINRLFVPAWEGGHHDHDAIHAVGVLVGMRHGLMLLTNQFPIYNGYNCKKPFYRVLLPLMLNGPIHRVRIPWFHRFRFLGYCLSYPSQATTWIGLFPFVLVHYLFNGSECSQPVSLARLHEPPHCGSLYYEMRGFYTWNRMKARIGSLFEKYIQIENSKDK